MLRLGLRRPCARAFASCASAPLPYNGFEQGPVRPPTERFSLKLRVSRNCPWNQCTFCPLFKGQRYSVRSVSDLKRDIDEVARFVRQIQASGDVSVDPTAPEAERLAATAAQEWVRQGMQDVFLQDANTMLVDPQDLLEVIRYLRQTFPSLRRVTSYARSHTLARLSDAALAQLKDAGLDRIHVGVESGSDAVLHRVRKGATQAIHIRAGQKVKRAGMELSVYIMPGLGGEDLSEEHAAQSAVVVNQVNADFVRIRSLFLTPNMRLYAEAQAGHFRPLSEVAKVAELEAFVERLEGITSELKSNDHFMNLLPEVDGPLPASRPRILGAIHAFQALAPEEQVVYMVGKRAAIFRSLQDLHVPELRAQAEAAVAAVHATPETVDRITQRLLLHFEQSLCRGGAFRFSPEALAAAREGGAPPEAAAA